MHRCVLSCAFLAIVAAGSGPCCKTCELPLVKYFSTDAPHGFCGEACMDPKKFWIYKKFEANLTKATSANPCSEQRTPSNTNKYTDYFDTVTHGIPHALSVTLDLYAPADMPDHSCCNTPLFSSLNCVGIPGKPVSLNIFGTGPYCCPKGATATQPCGGHGGKKAFVLLGATGDNAYRPAGVWNGLFEAWSNGILDKQPTDLHVQINQGHKVDEIRTKVMAAVQPFYADLQADKSWKCMAPGGDCSPEKFFKLGNFNIWEGIGRYNSSGQAANMSYLAHYDEVIAYMSVPPRAYQDWADAMVMYWGGGSKLQIAFEKPFGGGRDSLHDAIDLHKNILASGLNKDHFHLTDHWLSFFMNKHLPTFQKIVAPRLGLDWSTKGIQKIVVTEYEERGFGGRGAFIDGLGQVRDMVQSHLLQVLALTMVDPTVTDLSAAKLALFEELKLSTKGCELWQFDGLLASRYLKYHPTFADSTFSRVNLQSMNPKWKDVELVIQTAKAMDVNLYTVDIYQRGGSGVLTFDIGKEEVGTGDIKVANWALKDTSEFQAPLPGFTSGATATMKPAVDSTGNGYILRYNDPNLYFPKPYAKIVNALVTADYGAAFVTWQECQKCWEILTDSSPSVCLDPPPEKVQVYIPAFLCDKSAPAKCDQHETVKDKYDVKYSCTPQHNVWYADVDFYKAKCNISGKLDVATKATASIVV